ncbi:DUF726-domain-containing protein, partial [Polychaeton citri CBS 116435]
QEGESLTTILETQEDRASLTILIADCTELMRKRIVDAFDAKETGKQEDLFATLKNEKGEVIDLSSLSDDERHAQIEKLVTKQREDLGKREKEVGAEDMVTLKASALEYFDDWRDGMIQRVGEVVNSKSTAQKEAEHAKPKPKNAKSQPELQDPESSQHSVDIDNTMKELYPPVESLLLQLPIEQRTLILHSVLLLLLSLEHYHSHSRTLLAYLTTSLGLSNSVLTNDEDKVARGLLTAAENMNADQETQKRKEDNSSARKWKVGLAGVGGAVLIGVTGGLAAPFLAAGIGTVMGGLGLGATAAAGYLGTLAGSSVLVGGLFGAYGGRMTSQVMDQYARTVEDFAFVPIRTYHKPRKIEKEFRRLRVAIAISGWLQEKDDVVTPWRVIGVGIESFALRFELEALMNLGNALSTMVTSAAWGYAKSEIIKRTVFGALSAGLWPLALVKASRIIDNPWSVANFRAQKAGEVLADALINKAQGERPVTLVGYSLGAKVIFACCQQLADRKAFGLVENVILMGAPVQSSSAEWRRVRAVVTGRIVNAFSTNDYILGFLYRSSSISLGVAGLQPIANVKGIENVDVSDLVQGHTLYRHATGPILKKINFEDLDFEELRQEEERLKRQEEEEAEKRVAAEKQQGDGVEKQELSDEDVEKMEKEVEEKNKQSTMEWMTEKMKVAGSAPSTAY